MGAAGAGGEAQPSQFVFQGYVNNESGQVTYDWTVPAGVTSICAVVVGAGETGELSTSDADGGSGGDLRYVNNIAVTPGETLNLGAGIGFLGNSANMDGAHSQSGGASWVKRSNGSILVQAEGGNTVEWNHGFGVNGEIGNNAPSSGKGGNGGGAGGYDAGDDAKTGTWGGGGRGTTGYKGGGVGLTGGNEGQASSRVYGAGGGDGGDTSQMGAWQGCYGGGGGGMRSASTSYSRGSDGSPGAVRIIWGEGRSYPSDAVGVFKTAPAGTELEIRLMTPVYYMDPNGASAGEPVSAEYGSSRVTGFEIYDDNGTNLLDNDGQNANYDGMPILGSTGVNSGYTGNLNPAWNSPEFDFDDLSAGQWTKNSSYVTNMALLQQMTDTDKNDNSYNLGSRPLLQTDTDEYMTGAKHHDTVYDNNFIFKFSSPTVIKKIHFYCKPAISWIPRLRVILDGELIADDSPHFVDASSYSGYNSKYSDCRLAYIDFT